MGAIGGVLLFFMESFYDTPADSPQMVRLFTNLAVKYGSEMAPPVHVSCEKRAKALA